MKYGIAWNAADLTLTIQDADKTSTKKNEVISHLVYFNEGEIPDSASHPQPAQHLENLARLRNVDMFRVTVVNATDNDRLNAFVREPDARAVEQYERTRETRRVNNTGTEGVYGNVDIDNRPESEPESDETETVQLNT